MAAPEFLSSEKYSAKAGEALTSHALVIMGSAFTVTESDNATKCPFGRCNGDAASGAAVQIQPLRSGDIMLLIADGSVTVGTKLVCTTGGLVTDYSSGAAWIIGEALETDNASGDLVVVMIAPSYTNAT